MSDSRYAHIFGKFFNKSGNVPSSLNCTKNFPDKFYSVLEFYRTFQTFSSNLQVLSAGRVTRSKFRIEDQQILGSHPVAVVQYSTVQYSTAQHSTVQYSTAQYSTVQYSTVQHSTAQHSKAQ